MKTSFNKDEKYSFDLLQKHFESKGFIASYVKGSDAPDAIFSIDSEKWEIEHTTLHLYYEVNKKPYSMSNFYAIIHELEMWINKNNYACKDGWHLIINYPMSKSQLQKVKKALSSFFIDFKKDAFESISNHICEMRKSDFSQNEINVLAMLPGYTKIPDSNLPIANIQAVIDYSLQRIAKRKNKFIKSTVHSFHKRSLIIQNKYHFLSTYNFINALSKYSNNFSGLDSIILINNQKIEIFEVDS